MVKRHAELGKIVQKVLHENMHRKHRKERKEDACDKYREHVSEVAADRHLQVLGHVCESASSLDNAFIKNHEILFEKDIDEELLSVMVPSMIIQPLVENSIKYGIKDLEPGEGKVTLSVYREDKMCCIRVSDNGIGTDEEIIEKIMNHEKRPSETRGVGITNVMARLDLYYNNKEVFEMKSRKNEGTHVTIKIPLEGENV